MTDYYFVEKWTLEEIKSAVDEAKENGTINWWYLKNTHTELENLNEHLFKKRPDIILQFQHKYDNDLNVLSHFKNIKKIIFCNDIYGSSDKIKELNHLTYLQIDNSVGNKRPLDISFLEGLCNLNELHLSGKFKNVSMIGKCINLEDLYLRTTINNYSFMQFMDKIKKIYIDDCQAPNDFSLLNKPTLEVLGISSIRNLENVDSIKDFTALKKFNLMASELKRLPEMDKLVNLHELNLSLMKIWENPEVIKTIPSLEKLKLEEINTKLDVEHFYFLTEIKTLKEVDYRFIDFNKKRINKLNKWFIKNNKENIIKK
jgi:hypothetical protein